MRGPLSCDCVIFVFFFTQAHSRSKEGTPPRCLSSRNLQRQFNGRFTNLISSDTFPFRLLPVICWETFGPCFTLSPAFHPDGSSHSLFFLVSCDCLLAFPSHIVSTHNPIVYPSVRFPFSSPSRFFARPA